MRHSDPPPGTGPVPDLPRVDPRHRHIVPLEADVQQTPPRSNCATMCRHNHRMPRRALHPVPLRMRLVRDWTQRRALCATPDGFECGWLSGFPAGGHEDGIARVTGERTGSLVAALRRL